MNLPLRSVVMTAVAAICACDEGMLQTYVDEALKRPDALLPDDLELPEHHATAFRCARAFLAGDTPPWTKLLSRIVTRVLNLAKSVDVPTDKLMERVRHFSSDQQSLERATARLKAAVREAGKLCGG